MSSQATLAALAQLGYITTINFFTSWKATLTFNRTLIRRHTMFSIVQTCVQANSGNGAGQTMYFLLNRNADLLWRIYLKVVLPGLVQNSGSATYWYYCNTVGFALLRQTYLIMGGTPVEQFPDIWYDIWSECALAPGKQLYSMVGKYHTTQMLIDVAQQQQILWVPVPVYTFETPGQSIPMAATPLCEIKLQIEVRELAKIINGNPATPGMLPFKMNSDGTSSGVVIQPSDIQITVVAYYVYVEKPEREKFVNNMHEYLIEQVQGGNNTFAVGANQGSGSQFQIRQQFNHLIKALYVVARDNANLVTGVNDYFRYGTSLGHPIIQKMYFSVNNNPRVDTFDQTFFTRVNHFDFSNNIPRKHILQYSYGYFPWSSAPTGEMNYARVEDSLFYLTMVDSNPACEVSVLGFGFNVLRFVSGVIILAFL